MSSPSCKIKVKDNDSHPSCSPETSNHNQEDECSKLTQRTIMPLISVFQTGAATFPFKYLQICPHEAELTSFQTHFFTEKLKELGNEPGTSGSVAVNSGHYTTENNNSLIYLNDDATAIAMLFSDCDRVSRGHVRVSCLNDYMSRKIDDDPTWQAHNREMLQKLVQLLDPNQLDVEVTREQFVGALKTILKMSDTRRITV
ncbi:unnamed protein product [Timema podura]|uniref:Uncharacterized protein n=1 Tax=Timema podura TaxID=61482 RepID=A0ABN7PEZ8_TIMPD|nr:unnamed protein product [Timema podura]